MYHMNRGRMYQRGWWAIRAVDANISATKEGIADGVWHGLPRHMQDKVWQSQQDQSVEFSGWVNKERQAKFEALKWGKIPHCSNCGIPAECTKTVTRYGMQGAYLICTACMIELEQF